MTAPPLLALRDVQAGFGGRPLFDNVSFALGAGDRVCLVGRNGSGKSTLMALLAGSAQPDAGERFQQPGTRIAVMPQNPVFDATMTIADYVGADGAPTHRVAAILDELALPEDRQLAALSGGEGRRVSLARCLALDPDVLLLDEPTNHLDIPAILWLEDRLQGFFGALLMVSHDRAFLTRLSTRTLWLDRGRLRQTDRGYGQFDAWSEEVLAAEAAETHRLDRKLVSETRWAREGISARRKRNQGRVERLRLLRQDRAERIGLRRAKFDAGTSGPGGRVVIEAEHVAKSFTGPDGTPRVIAKDFGTRILRGDRIGIIGPNGAGKSTLLSILIGRLEPDAGLIRQGANIDIAFFDQQRSLLDPEETPWTTLTGGKGDNVFVRGKPRHVVSYLKDFLFDDRQFQAKVNSLSGGERNRLLLAKVLALPSNLLVLDEPTNDLDMDTLDLLEEVLSDYEGTLLLVSHDRDFLDRLVTSVIAVEGDGEVMEYVGGYSDYLRQREPRRIVSAPKGDPKVAAPRPAKARPTRLSYKDARELDELPRRIEALTAEQADLERRLSDSAFYSRDPGGFASATKRLTQATAELAAAEDRWLDLAAQAEERGGS